MAGIPGEAVGAFVGVLIYSLINFFLCATLVALLISYGEKFTYVTIHSTFTAITTLASIVQQVHYAVAWRAVKQAQFEKALRAVDLPGLTFVGGAHPVDRALYLIQFWCYNVMALNTMFWAITLFIGTWGLRTPWLGTFRDRIGMTSKIFSFVYPSFIVGLLHVNPILRHLMGTFVVSNGTMFISLITGSVLLILILFKYVQTRRLATGGSRRGGWWASQNNKSHGSHDVGSNYVNGTRNTSTRSSIYDRALLIRFSIGFTLLALFLVAIIIFSYISSTTNTAIVAAGRPDLTAQGATTDILLFIPGVTVSIVTFLVFGTAKSWRQYRDLFAGGCGVRTKILQRRFIRQQERGERGEGQEDLEFAPLPRLETTVSTEIRMRTEETAKRVKMFSTTTTVITAGDSPSPEPERRQALSTIYSETESVQPLSELRTPRPWDRQSFGETTVISEPIDHDLPVIPHALSPRPAQHQTKGSLGSQRSMGQNINFHRPMPSVGRAQVVADANQSAAYGTKTVNAEQEDDVVQAAKPAASNPKYSYIPSTTERRAS